MLMRIVSVLFLILWSAWFGYDLALNNGAFQLTIDALLIVLNGVMIFVEPRQ